MQLNSKTKVAVVGANGQLGYQLLKKLTGIVQLNAFDRASLDITNELEVKNKLASVEPDIIINAAAYTAVDKAELEPKVANAVNHLGAKYLALTAEKLNAILIHVSTDYVFDGLNNIPYQESDDTNPQNVYGKTKLEGERAVINNCTKYIILRTAWVFGEHGNNFVKTMLRLAQSKSELDVVSDQFGGPTYAGDIAEAIISICNQVLVSSDKWGVYHFSGKPYVSWDQFALGIFEQAENKQVIAKCPIVRAITTAEYPTPAKRPCFSKLACTKIATQFNIEPSDWQRALANIDFV